MHIVGCSGYKKHEAMSCKPDLSPKHKQQEEESWPVGHAMPDIFGLLKKCNFLQPGVPTT